jgi:arylsulfatase
MDNTLVLALSDNGASSEGGPEGTFNNQARQVDSADTDVSGLVNDWGSRSGYYHYAWAWAWAGNTPFRLWKRYSWLGGIRTPLIAHWPRRIADAGAVRQQFCHAIDIMPTVLEACGVTVPGTIDGVSQQRVDGASLLATFARADAPSPRDRQYFEIIGSRSIVSGEWKATTDHVSGGSIWEQRLLVGSRRFEEDHWALFHLPTDYAEANDVSAEHPEVVQRLIEEWFVEAGRNNVLPITDLMHGRAPEQVIAPTYPPRARSVFLPGGSPVFDKWVPSFAAGARITADVDLPNGRAQGILCALGDRTSGFAFYVKDDSLVFAMSAQGRDARIAAGLPPLSGHHALTCVLAPEGEYMRFTLELDGRRLGEARHRVSVPPLWQFGGSGLCLGYDRPLSVTDEYEPPFPWSGALRSLVVEVPPEQPPDVPAEVRATLKVE